MIEYANIHSTQQTSSVHVSDRGGGSRAARHCIDGVMRRPGVTERQRRLTPRRKDGLLLPNLGARKRRARHEISSAENVRAVSGRDARTHLDSSLKAASYRWADIPLQTESGQRRCAGAQTDTEDDLRPKFERYAIKDETFIPEFGHTSHRCSILPSLAGIPSFEEK